MKNRDAIISKLTEYGVMVLIAISIVVTILAGILDGSLYQLNNKEDIPFEVRFFHASQYDTKTSVITFELDSETYPYFVYQTFGIDTVVSIDGEQFYADSLKPYTVIGMKWHKINITDEKTHTVEISYITKHRVPFIPSKLPTIYTFYFGGANIIDHIMYLEAFKILIGIVSFIIGIILCLIYIFNKKIGAVHIHTLYFGIISIIIAVWSLISTVLTQAVFPYDHTRGVIFIICILLYPLLFFVYSENKFDTRTKPPTSTIHIGLIIIFNIIMLLDVFNIEQLILVYFLCTAVEGVFHTRAVIQRWRIPKPKNWFYVDAVQTETDEEKKEMQKESYILLLQSSLILVIAIVNIFMQNAVFTSALMQMIAILFILSRFMKECTIVIETSKDSGSLEMYKRIALMDSLTGIGNRQAFTMALKSVDITKLCIVSFDINNLKYHNDTFGHLIGDKLLCDSASLLKNVYGEEHVYRFGGDEFAAIIEGTTPKEQEALKAKMNRMCEQFNAKSQTVQISIACGYAFYSDRLRTAKQILTAADEKMYKDKAYLKSIGVAFDVRDQKEATPFDQDVLNSPTIDSDSDILHGAKSKRETKSKKAPNTVQHLFDSSNIV